MDSLTGDPELFANRSVGDQFLLQFDEVSFTDSCHRV
jgi:hypothetical protein